MNEWMLSIEYSIGKLEMGNNTLEINEVIFSNSFSLRNYFSAFPIHYIFKDVYSFRIFFKNHDFKSSDQYTEYGPTPLWVYLIMIGMFVIGISLIYFAMKKPRTPERMSLLNPVLLTTLLASFYELCI